MMLKSNVCLELSQIYKYPIAEFEREKVMEELFQGESEAKKDSKATSAKEKKKKKKQAAKGTRKEQVSHCSFRSCSCPNANFQHPGSIASKI